MISDRGMKKWTSLMLTEHVEELEKLWREFDKKKRPILDEQAWLEIERTIQEAYIFKKELRLKVYQRGEFIYKIGEISHINQMERTLRIADTQIEFVNLLQADLYE